MSDSYSYVDSPKTGNLVSSLVGAYASDDSVNFGLQNFYSNIPILVGRHPLYSNPENIINTVNGIQYVSTTRYTLDISDIYGSLGNLSASYWNSTSAYPIIKYFYENTNIQGYTTAAPSVRPWFVYDQYGFDDPHIVPIYGKEYMLPHIEDTYLLFDNNDEKDRLVIKGKTWFIPISNTTKFIKSLIENGNIGYHKEMIRRLEDTTYFKYIKIEYNDEVCIIDMEYLQQVEYTTENDLNNNNLPLSNKRLRSITIHNMTNSNMAVNFKKESEKYNDKIKRIINVGNHSITLVSNLGEIKGNNGIKLSAPYAPDASGALVRQEDAKVVSFT